MIDDIRAALADAVRYPSPDNTQPYTWMQTDGTRWCLKLSTEKSQHPFNPDGANDWITFGHLAESVRLESAVRGLAVKISSDFHAPPSEVEFAFTKSSEPCSPTEADLQRNLQKRETDRRRFSDRHPDHRLLDKLKSLTTDGIEFRFVLGVPQNFFEAALDLESSVWRWRKFAQATLASTKLEWGKVPEVGLNPRNLGVPKWQTFGLPLLRDSAWFYELAVRAGGTQINRRILERQLRHTGWLGFYLTNSVDSRNLYEVGRTNLRVWTELNSCGFGVQPLTASTLVPSFSSIALDRVGWPLEVKVALEKMSVVHRDLFGTQKKIIWGFRSGGSTPLPSEMRTGRQDWIRRT